MLTMITVFPICYRYLVICYPMKAQYISTPGRAKKIIAVVWVAAVGLSAVPSSFVSGVTLCSLMRQNDLRVSKLRVVTKY